MKRTAGALAQDLNVSVAKLIAQAAECGITIHASYSLLSPDEVHTVTTFVRTGLRPGLLTTGMSNDTWETRRAQNRGQGNRRQSIADSSPAPTTELEVCASVPDHGDAPADQIPGHAYSARRPRKQWLILKPISVHNSVVLRFLCAVGDRAFLFVAPKARLLALPFKLLGKALSVAWWPFRSACFVIIFLTVPVLLLRAHAVSLTQDAYGDLKTFFWYFLAVCVIRRVIMRIVLRHRLDARRELVDEYRWKYKGCLWGPLLGLLQWLGDGKSAHQQTLEKRIADLDYEISQATNKYWACVLFTGIGLLGIWYVEMEWGWRHLHLP